MANIKTLVQPFASEAVIQAAVDAVNQATPPNIIPAAQVMRDANGKVVEVVVNLPASIAQSDLSNAEDALNGLPDVAKAVAYPKSDIVLSLDTLTPGTVLTSIEGPSGSFNLSTYGNTAQWKAGEAADSYGGTGSCLEFKDLSLERNHSGSLLIPASSVSSSLSDMGAFKLAFKAKAPSGGDNVYMTSSLTVRMGSVIIELSVITHNASLPVNSWNISINDFMTNIFATGGANNVYSSFEISQSIDGVFSVKLNGTVVASHDSGFVKRTNTLSLNAYSNAEGNNSVLTTNLNPSILIDDLSISVLS